MHYIWMAVIAAAVLFGVFWSLYLICGFIWSLWGSAVDTLRAIDKRTATRQK